MILTYNRSHFQQAFDSSICRDKIYQSLTTEETITKILNGTVQPIDCDDDNVFLLLSLFKRDEDTVPPTYQPITSE